MNYISLFDSRFFVDKKYKFKDFVRTINKPQTKIMLITGKIWTFCNFWYIIIRLYGRNKF